MKKLLFVVLAIVCFSTFSANADSYSYKKGYRGNVGLGLSNFSGEKIFEEDFFVLETNHGYSFGNGLYAGAGITVFSKTGINANYGMVPIYAECKYNFLNKLVSPFVDARIGLNVATYEDTETNTVTGKTGFMASPMVGVDIWRFSLAFFYQFNSFKNSSSNRGLLGVRLYFNW